MRNTLILIGVFASLFAIVYMAPDKKSGPMEPQTPKAVPDSSIYAQIKADALVLNQNLEKRFYKEVKPFEDITYYVHGRWKTTLPEYNTLVAWTDDGGNIYLRSIYRGTLLNHNKIQVKIDSSFYTLSSVAEINTDYVGTSFMESVTYKPLKYFQLLEHIYKSTSPEVSIKYFGVGAVAYEPLNDRTIEALRETFILAVAKQNI